MKRKNRKFIDETAKVDTGNIAFILKEGTIFVFGGEFYSTQIGKEYDLLHIRYNEEEYEDDYED